MLYYHRRQEELKVPALGMGRGETGSAGRQGCRVEVWPQGVASVLLGGRVGAGPQGVASVLLAVGGGLCQGVGAWSGGIPSCSLHSCLSC